LSFPALTIIESWSESKLTHFLVKDTWKFLIQNILFPPFNRSTVHMFRNRNISWWECTILFGNNLSSCMHYYSCRLRNLALYESEEISVRYNGLKHQTLSCKLPLYTCFFKLNHISNFCQISYCISNFFLVFVQLMTYFTHPHFSQAN